MNIYVECNYGGGMVKEWNCCHPSGFAGKVVEFFDNYGHLNGRIFYLNGKLHRDLADGPAVTHFSQTGEVTSEFFWLDGEYVEDHSDNRNTTRKVL